MEADNPSPRPFDSRWSPFGHSSRSVYLGYPSVPRKRGEGEEGHGKGMAWVRERTLEIIDAHFDLFHLAAGPGVTVTPGQQPVIAVEEGT